MNFSPWVLIGVAGEPLKMPGWGLLVLKSFPSAGPFWLEGYLIWKRGLIWIPFGLPTPQHCWGSLPLVPRGRGGQDMAY